MFDRFEEIDKFELTITPPIEELEAISDTGEFFASFIELLQADLVKHNIRPTDASKIVSHIVCKLASAFSGETFYVSRKPLMIARQMAIYADLQTMKHRDVDKKYGVSNGYSLTIAKKIDDMRKHRDQLRLF